MVKLQLFFCLELSERVWLPGLSMENRIGNIRLEEVKIGRLHWKDFGAVFLLQELPLTGVVC